MKKRIHSFLLLILVTSVLIPSVLKSQVKNENPELDAKVKKFLSEHSGQWRDLNIPTADGQMLYDLILKGNYKSALEIGTSTGHSGIYLAWALAKTGGKLITMEIDESRLKTALDNFRQAGLSEYIDARLGDAHILVKEVKGPFDFVFSDADKDWYINYFKAVDPKFKVGGCYTTHNVSGRGGRGYGQGSSYLDFLKSLKNYETTVFTGGGGLAISYKTAEK